MGKEKVQDIITSFTSKGDFFAILYPQGFVKVWNTSDGSLLAEWNPSIENKVYRISCMSCAFIGKKSRKAKGACLVALGTNDGDVLVIDVITSEMKWKSTGRHPGGIVGLSFANDGSRLCTVGKKGISSEMNPETGELVKEFKLSKKSIISSSFSRHDKVVVATTANVRVFSLEDGNELIKLPVDLGPVQHISVSDDAKAIVTSDSDKNLQVWKCELGTGSVNIGPTLSMKKSPLDFECRSSSEDSIVVLSVSDSSSGVAYIWNLNMLSADDVKPIKISVKARKTENDLHSNSGKGRKSHIIAAKIHALTSNDQVTALIAYGSIKSPQFTLLDIPSTGEDIVITTGDEAEEMTTNTEQIEVPAGIGLHQLQAEADVFQKVKSSKKRAASEAQTADMEVAIDLGHGEPMDGVQTDDDVNEPTMGEKLADLNLVDVNKIENREQQESSPQTMLPTADSIHLLLKQALHAYDRALLLDCLYRKDEKVVANSVSLLNPSDVLKILQSLVSLVRSRGAVLACALPWLRSLLLQHSSEIMSQESSLVALNSLYQLIESRVSTLNPVFQLSSSLDLLYAGTIYDEADEDDIAPPTIFEDKDDSDEEEYEDAMEIVEEDNIEAQTFSDISDIDE